MRREMATTWGAQGVWPESKLAEVTSGLCRGEFPARSGDRRVTPAARKELADYIQFRRSAQSESQPSLLLPEKRRRRWSGAIHRATRTEPHPWGSVWRGT